MADQTLVQRLRTVEHADTAQRYLMLEAAEALDLFMRAAYPVSGEINPRGYNWSEAYLDQALANARGEA